MNDECQLAQLALDNADAKQWYELAQQEISFVCKLENWDVKHFTGILAVTSPRCAVRRNIRIALQYVSTGEFLANTLPSVRRSVEIFETSGEIRGPKTSAFYAALTGDIHAVVLDTHMANLFEVDQKNTFRRKPDIAFWTQTVRNVAKRITMTARECQACLWFGHKRSVGDNPEEFPIIGEYRNWLAHNRSFPASGYITSDTVDDDISFNVAEFDNA